MSRPKLSSMSTLLPAKGGATIPEPLPNSQPASQPPGQQSVPPAGQQAGQQAQPFASGADAQLRIETGARMANPQGSLESPGLPASLRSPPDEPRTTVSARLPLSLQRRLREYAHRQEVQKQDIIEAALNEFLAREGF
jgi:hypothetical protein